MKPNKLLFVKIAITAGRTWNYLFYIKTFFGCNSLEYKESIDNEVDFLCFWGKYNYDTVIHWPIYKRQKFTQKVIKNLELLFGKNE